MKTIFFLLFIVAIACGVYKCCYKDDDNRKEYIAETGLVYENEYADMDTFVADENYNINEVNVMAIPAENDAVEYK